MRLDESRNASPSESTRMSSLLIPTTKCFSYTSMTLSLFPPSLIGLKRTFGTFLTTSSKHRTVNSMTKDINVLVVFFAQCRNLNRNVWKCNVFHTSNGIGLRQSRKSVGRGYYKTRIYTRAIHTGRTFGHRYTREQFNEASQWVGFSESPISSGVGIGQWSEDEIAEAIFDWWIRGKT